MTNSRRGAVETRGLVVERGGNTVLHGLDLKVEAGRITGLLGPSGSGKTTLMRAIVGVQIVKDGDVRVLGEPAGSPAVRSRVGYVTQAPAVYGDLTVRENLRYFADVLGAPASEVDDAIETVKLGAFADRQVRNLSGGQRSRASLATALLARPELLVLDEPTVGLDPVLREGLWGTFNDLVEAGATLLVSSNVMDEAERCQRLLLMRDGRMLADATADELRERTGEKEMDRVFIALVRGAEG